MHPQAPTSHPSLKKVTVTETVEVDNIKRLGQWRNEQLDCLEDYGDPGQGGQPRGAYAIQMIQEAGFAIVPPTKVNYRGDPSKILQTVE